MLQKCCLRKTIRPVEETAGFVIFSKCRVVFSKCCLRVPSGPCRMTEKYEKTPEQACDNRQSAPVHCKDNTFFAEIQIAQFRVNISQRRGAVPQENPWVAGWVNPRSLLSSPCCLADSSISSLIPTAKHAMERGLPQPAAHWCGFFAGSKNYCLAQIKNSSRGSDFLKVYGYLCRICC